MIRPMKLVYFSMEYDNINHMMNQMVIDGFNPNEIKVYLSGMYNFTDSTIDSIIDLYQIVERYNEKCDREFESKPKQKNNLDFKYQEDKRFFLELFGYKMDETYKIVPYFDFRSQMLKRKEFNSKKPKILQQLLQDNGKICMLNLSPNCSIESGLSVDHIIPISTNVLNKELRMMKPNEKNKKVVSESYGSNHFDNLIIACNHCNNHKKHRLLSKEKMIEVLIKKQN